MTVLTQWILRTNFSNNKLINYYNVNLISVRGSCWTVSSLDFHFDMYILNSIDKVGNFFMLWRCVEDILCVQVFV